MTASRQSVQNLEKKRLPITAVHIWHGGRLRRRRRALGGSRLADRDVQEKRRRSAGLSRRRARQDRQPPRHEPHRRTLAIRLRQKHARKSRGLKTTLTVIAACVVTEGMVWLLDWPAPSALVFSVLIAATDPVAIIAMFKDNKFKGRLCLLVESESLLNDGAAAVLFVMALAWAQSAGHAQASLEMVTTLVRIVLGGVIIGAAFGGVAILVAKRTSEHLIEAALTTVAAYGSFLAAEYFDVSGVLATVTAGLTIGVAKGALIHTDEYDIYARVSYGDTDTRPFATDAANMRAIRTATAFMKSVSIRRGLLVAAAFMAATASRRRPRKVAALSRLLPVRAQCQKTWKSAADGAR